MMNPDLILLDINMPEIDGYEVCSQLKNNAATRHIPVIFVTGRVDEHDEYKGFSLGAADYIAKPISVKILNAKIAVHLKFKSMRDEHRLEIEEQKKTIKIFKRSTREHEEHIAQIEQKKHNLEQILNTVSDVITIHDLGRRLVWANSAALKTFKASLQEIQGRSCHEVYHGVDGPCSNCQLGEAIDEQFSEVVDVYNEKFDIKLRQSNLSLLDRDKNMVGIVHTAQVVSGSEIEKSQAPPESETGKIFDDIDIYLKKNTAELTKLNEYISEAADRLRGIFSELRRYQDTSA